jgi:hypothetical protein
MAEYWDRAVYIFEHGRLYENSFRTPGYPVALALSFHLGSGPSLYAARMLNVFSGVAMALLTYWLTRRTASPRSSLVAALAVALYPSFLMHTAVVATEAFFMPPLLATLIAATYPGRLAAAATGVFIGLTISVRPSGLALLPTILVSCLRPEQFGATSHPSPFWIKFGLARATLILVSCACTLAPWWLHNFRIHQRFIPTDTGLGVNLMIGNGPNATGNYESTVLGPLVTAPDSRTPSGSDRLAAQALSYAWQHPAATLSLIPRKVLHLLSMEWRDPALVYSWSFLGPLQPYTVWFLGLLTALSFPLVLIAAAIGLAVRAGTARPVLLPSLLFVGTTVLMHVILFGEARYHLPLVPLLALFATGVAKWRHGFNPWRLTAATVAILWLAVQSWSPQIGIMRTILPKLAAPDGWTSHLVYDDFLRPYQ